MQRIINLINAMSENLIQDIKNSNKSRTKACFFLYKRKFLSVQGINSGNIGQTGLSTGCSSSLYRKQLSKSETIECMFYELSVVRNGKYRAHGKRVTAFCMCPFRYRIFCV